jgi:hypothetical protein
VYVAHIADDTCIELIVFGKSEGRDHVGDISFVGG